MREQFPQLSNRLYFRPDVHVEVEDGRSFVRRSPEKYQVIQATLVDTWASTAAGAFALSENNLYTTDAIRDYLEHLTDDGLDGVYPLGLGAAARIAAAGVAGDRGARQIWARREPWRHIIVGRERGSTQGWGAHGHGSDLPQAACCRPIWIGLAAALRSAQHAARLSARASDSAMPFTELLRSRDPAAFERDIPSISRPVSDNRPFFFYTRAAARPVALPHALHPDDTADYKINKAVPLLFAH